MLEKSVRRLNDKSYHTTFISWHGWLVDIIITTHFSVMSVETSYATDTSLLKTSQSVKRILR